MCIVRHVSLTLTTYATPTASRCAHMHLCLDLCWACVSMYLSMCMCMRMYRNIYMHLLDCVHLCVYAMHALSDWLWVCVYMNACMHACLFVVVSHTLSCCTITCNGCAHRVSMPLWVHASLKYVCMHVYMQVSMSGARQNFIARICKHVCMHACLLRCMHASGHCYVVDVRSVHICVPDFIDVCMHLTCVVCIYMCACVLLCMPMHCGNVCILCGRCRWHRLCIHCCIGVCLRMCLNLCLCIWFSIWICASLNDDVYRYAWIGLSQLICMFSVWRCI